MTWKKYCVDLLGLSLIVIVAYIIPAEWVRHRLNEVYVGDDIAIDMQLNENALYESALMEDICFLKYCMISRTEPDIIALGTSRSMQFRAAFFKGATFYTTGGMGDSIDAMEAIFDHICINYVPKIVIFAVDWDWLNPNYPHPKLRYVENNTLASEGHRAFILQFEDAVRSLCVVQDVPFYDFTNMAWLGASDEEAFDGFHASERTYGRITLQFESDPVIAPYINKDFIEACMVNSNHPFQIIPADM